MIFRSPLTLKVAKIDVLNDTLKRYILVDPAGGMLPPPPPGSHLTFLLSPRSGKAIKNSYSVISPTLCRDHYEIIVRRASQSRGGSKYFHEEVRNGDLLTADVPRSNFAVHSQARKSILIAGGIGITPLLSLLNEIGIRENEAELHIVCRPSDRSALEVLLRASATAEPIFHEGRNFLDISAILADQPLGTHVYVCGPLDLMRYVQAVAHDLGYPGSNVHFESFGATVGNAFTAKVQGLNKEITVGESESLLEALEREGIEAPYSCRGGACGQCIVEVVEGGVDHRDFFLSEKERASRSYMTPCVSRASGKSLTIAIKQS